MKYIYCLFHIYIVSILQQFLEVSYQYLFSFFFLFFKSIYLLWMRKERVVQLRDLLINVLNREVLNA